ncbi:hypothetical protein [Chitinibacter sp. GC72]|uniref:DUF6916 family protein n=1 Tax=Chitinibacter sp. GC72 TaxID=1526917 RepID=UPI0012F9AB9D|nr:hypothetical protein [Chitinibacter sp. GC72]
MLNNMDSNQTEQNMHIFRLEAFSEHIHSDFDIFYGDHSVGVLQLISATPAPGSTDSRHFSLIFSGQPTPHLPQRTYHFVHAILGRFDLFIVPIGPDRQTGQMLYEAIINQ